MGADYDGPLDMNCFFAVLPSNRGPKYRTVAISPGATLSNSRCWHEQTRSRWDDI